MRKLFAVCLVLFSWSFLSNVALAGAEVVPPVTTTTTTTPPVETAPVVAAGVTVASRSMEGKTSEQVVADLKAYYSTHYANTEPLTVRIGGKRYVLKMSVTDYRVALNKTAAKAMAATPGSNIVPVPTWNKQAVGDWIDKVAAVNKPVKNAQLILGITKQRFKKAASGWKIDRKSLSLKVNAALDEVDGPRSISQPVTPVKPTVTITSLRKQWGTFISVDRVTFRLRLFKNLRLSKTYKVAVGAAGHSTPAGMYKVTSKDPRPAWHVPNADWAGSLAGKVIPYGDPRNPIKARWMGLADGVGIHGTAEVWSLGSRASHGCIRMHPEDVKKLYAKTPLGTPVKIR